MCPEGANQAAGTPDEEEQEGEEGPEEEEELPEEFEERFRVILERMGFSDVNGGRAFRLGDHQIDACGGIDDTLLVFDCTITRGRRNTARQVRTKIEQWRARSRAVLEGVRSHPVYSRYHSVEFAIAANAPVSQTDVEYGRNGRPIIPVLNRQQIEYLERITLDLGPYAKYKLATLLGVRIRRATRPIPAIRVVDRHKPLYIFFAVAKEIAELAFVPQAEAGFSFFYQRLIKRSKIRAITDYVAEIARPFPNSVVISMDRDPAFRPTSHDGEASGGPDYPEITPGILELPAEYGCCWVVDGQHRIYGSAMSATEVLLPVTLIPANNLERAKYFLDVNSNQTKIDPNLLWYLRGVLTPDEPEGRISLTCQKLDDIESPLRGKIKIPPRGSGRSRPIRLSGICDAVLRNHILSLQPYRAGEPDVVRHLASDLAAWFVRVTSAVENEDLKEDFLLDNGGLAVQIAIFKRIAKRLERRRPTSADLELYAAVLPRWAEQLSLGDPEVLASRCASEGGRAQVADEIVFVMNSHLEPNLRLEISGRAQDLLHDITTFESEARRTLDTAFCETIGEGWLRQAGLGQSGRDPPSTDELTLGQIKTLLARDQYWSIIRPRFDVLNVTKELAQGLFEYVINFRNAHMHNRPEDLRNIDTALVKTALASLRKCLSPRNASS